MKNIRNKKGFTLAEMMLVVGVIIVLASIAFISLFGYARVLRHLQYDETAREIFISAQNHLSMVYEEGYLNNNITTFGQLEDSEKTNIYNPDLNKAVYYFVVNDGDEFTSTGTSMLDNILPFGSVDESIRIGSYIIRYCPDTGDILDVFYSDKADKRYGFTFTQLYGYNPELMNIRDDSSKDTRRNYINKKVIGYFGDDSADLDYGDEIETPYMRIINEEKLKVVVRMNQDKPTTLLKLYIKGDVSNVTVVEDIKLGINNDKSNISSTTGHSYSEYIIVLDDITNGANHFNNLYPELIPGENLSIYVEASSNTELTNIAKSIVGNTNSLFGDESTVKGSDESTYNAEITNIRHLENLDAKISNLDVDLNSAIQTANLDWDDFKTKTNGNSTTIYGFNGSTILKENGLYYPVELPTDYEGKLMNDTYPIISNIKTHGDENSGLFSIVDNKDVKNIELYKFEIAGTNAGMLAGKIINNSDIENVVGWGDTSKVSATTYGGGLVGECRNSSIYKSAASSDVTGNYAGGLVAYANSSEITYSYASAHVLNDGSYDTTDTNVGSASSTYAGGLVGYSELTTINNSYSTCSAQGNTVGGLVGYYSGNKPITYSYVTGYVTGNNVGTFIGNDTSGAAHSDNKYLMLTNDYLLLTPNGMRTIGNIKNNISGIKAIDESTATYRDFIKSDVEAKPYKTILKNAYEDKYLFRSIEEIRIENAVTIESNDFVSKHYGDWPSYETLIINKAS